MGQERVLINFRTTIPNKKGLDYLAERSGCTVTQFLNNLIFNEIKGAIVTDAQFCALKVTCIEFKLPDHLFMELKYFPRNFWELLTAALGEKKVNAFGDRYKKLLFERISSEAKKIDIEDFDVSYSELMKSFSEN